MSLGCHQAKRVILRSMAISVPSPSEVPVSEIGGADSPSTALSDSDDDAAPGLFACCCCKLV